MHVPRPYDAVMISLRPIDEANREAVELLDVSPEQQRFVSNAADSIREAAREPESQTVADCTGPSMRMRRPSAS